jgi:eukaryotic-like serine/threonine-protein kinase
LSGHKVIEKHKARLCYTSASALEPFQDYFYEPSPTIREELVRFINLFRDHRPLGRFDVPEHVISANGNFFRLIQVTLKGGNGIVFRANQVGSNRAVGVACAVKLLRQQNPARVDRFNNEVRVLKELDSPHISKYFDSGSVEVTSQADRSHKESVPWVAMQLGGQNMRQHVERCGPLLLDKLQLVTPGICAAVSHLHEKGFIHRDIKPDNFVWRDDRQNELLMIDFGIAKRQMEDVSGRPMDTFTQVTEFVGPVFFSSPELIEYARNKKHPVDYRSDIFQVGKLLWYLATAKISAGIPSRRECPAGGKLRSLVIDMIDDDPASRPQSLAEVETFMAAL